MRDIDSDEEDFVFVGTPIEREEDVSSRKKKAVAEASSQLRTLPSWKQEVRDEEGRRRFHGAFTGGYSAGFYNTVGSKEGWAPQSFTSSRKNRAEAKKQSILDFLDEDEKEEMGGKLVGTSSQFDTFGFTAAELARKQAEQEQKQRPSAIPGPVPDELVIPAAESIGVKLLLKMGWRHGRSIKDSSVDSLHEARREARKAFLALSSAQKVADAGGSESYKIDSDNSMVEPVTNDVESSHGTPIYVRQPKQDLYGLGFDPYKHAPEFREMKRSRLSSNKEVGFRKPFSSRQEPVTAKSGRLAPGFGIGALEELDVEDEDIYSSAHNYAETYAPNDDDEPSRLPIDDEEKTAGVDRGAVPRFKAASNSEYQLERFDPPIVPNDFVPQHKFPSPVETSNSVNGFAPPEVPPPHDNNLKVMIEGVAALVARCGKLFEDISREKNRSNPLFSFLYGGSGQDYYTRKLWEAQQKCKDQIKIRPDEKLYSTLPKMTAENRGKLLGERPLDRTLKDLSSKASVADDDVHAPSNSSDTFTKPEVLGELFKAAKPFKDDPAKQERFEQFLKDKYEGGLRATDSGKSTFMSEAARARERLDFEAAAETIEKSKLATQSKLPDKQSVDFTLGMGMQFTSGGFEDGKDNSAEVLMSKKYPLREEFQWRPAPLLCKRFDIVDPFMGKPPPAPRMRGKLDSLVFTPDTAKNMKTEDGSPMLLKSNDEPSMDLSSNEAEDTVEIENVERPVDLYKAIFSDDSDNDEDASTINQTEDPQKKTEAASAAFSRIVAGDFLESLGKELGLEVPPDVPPATVKAVTPVAHKEATQDSRGTNMTAENFLSSPLDGSASQEAPYNIISGPVVDDKDRVQEQSEKDVNNNVKLEKGDRRGKKEKYELRSSSSEDEKSRKRSKKHHRRRSSSDDDDSDDSRDRHKSRSRDEKRRSSRKKHRRRKHSRH